MIHNRDKFLTKISTALNHAQIAQHQPIRNWLHHPSVENEEQLTTTELMAVFVEQCARLNNTTVVEVPAREVVDAIASEVQKYGGDSVALWKDARLEALNIQALTDEKWPKDQLNVHVWDSKLGRTKNFERTNASNIGIAFAEYALAETGTVVLYSAEGQGKAVGLLPNAFIAIVKKSTLRPRITQAVAEIHSRVAQGDLLPAAIDFVSGPSNSADIEMDLVVGVHGPIYVSYIVISDQ